MHLVDNPLPHSSDTTCSRRLTKRRPRRNTIALWARAYTPLATPSERAFREAALLGPCGRQHLDRQIYPVNISDFAEQQVDAIVAEWVEFAHSRVPSIHRLSFEELADHARVLLLAIAADIRQSQGARAKHAKSRGDAPENAPEITRIARNHAEQRFAQGFSLEHLVSEFRALRASVIRRWGKQVNAVAYEAFDELTRFGEAMDQALTASVSLYSKKVDDSRNLLLAVLGHDLRTPLSVVHMTARYLLAADTLDPPETKGVARILTSAERMNAMVNDILDFTRTALGVPLPIVRAPADMGELTLNIVNEVSTVHPDCKILVSCEGSLAGNWDAARVGQLLSNLIANAVQHGEPGKPVSVLLTGDDAAVSVRIQNEGAPISAAAQKNLFTPLRQSAGERRAGSSGLGLGLYISREIAVAHGGSIEVSSDENATTFCVRLPRTPPRDS